jgi:hypothetical protein
MNRNYMSRKIIWVEIVWIEIIWVGIIWVEIIWVEIIWNVTEQEELMFLIIIARQLEYSFATRYSFILYAIDNIVWMKIRGTRE